MYKDDNLLKIEFSFTDEYGQESTLKKSFTPAVLEVSDTLNLLVDEFKSFLRVSGFTDNLVDRIYLDEN